jgi:hypothetical protein
MGGQVSKVPKGDIPLPYCRKKNIAWVRRSLALHRASRSVNSRSFENAGGLCFISQSNVLGGEYVFLHKGFLLGASRTSMPWD